MANFGGAEGKRFPPITFVDGKHSSFTQTKHSLRSRGDARRLFPLVGCPQRGAKTVGTGQYIGWGFGQGGVWCEAGKEIMATHAMD